jgi:hypothetical protein
MKEGNVLSPLLCGDALEYVTGKVQETDKEFN